MSEKLQRFKVYKLTSIMPIDDTLFSSIANNNSPYKIYFDGRDNKFDFKLPNEKVGFLYVKEKTETYIIGDYSVLPNKDNNFYKNVDTAKYNPLEETTKKTVGGYFPLFYIDLVNGKLFFQDMTEVSSFKKVFNKWLKSKEVYLEHVLVDNPKDEIKKLFASIKQIEICKVEQEEPENTIANINKKIDKKLIKSKTVFSVKNECKLNVEELVDDLFDEINLEEFSMLKVKGQAKEDNKELPYDVIKDALIVRSSSSIDVAKFSFEKNKDYVLSIFQQLSQSFQQNSSK